MVHVENQMVKKSLAFMKPARLITEVTKACH
jgi:hypothetical protein